MDKMCFCVQIVSVGGLFPQFIDGDVDQAGAREMAAVQLAIDRVNDKYDGSYDNLLPNTQVSVQENVFLWCMCCSFDNCHDN